MNCHAAQRLLSAERDGALASSERASLDAHLAECGECRQMRTVLAAAVENLRAANAQITVPDADRAWQDIRRAIRTTAPAGSRERGAFPRWALPLTVAAALALAATLAPRWLGNPATPTTARLEVARADFVETANNTSSMVYVDDKSGWLVVWAVDDKDKM